MPASRFDELGRPGRRALRAPRVTAGAAMVALLCRGRGRDGYQDAIPKRRWLNGLGLGLGAQK
jgi:hypothetical protein